MLTVFERIPARSTYYDRHPEQREKARLRTKAWVEANRDRKRASDEAYRQQNSEKVSEYGKVHYQKNRDDYRQRSREHYLANSEVYKSRALKWAKDHPKEMYAKTKARRIKRRDSLKKSLMKAQRGRCAYCRRDLKAAVVHIDHVMPIALGGTNARSNLQLTCDACNFSKNARHPIDFARTMGMLL